MTRYDVPEGEHSEFEPGSHQTVLRNTQGVIEQTVAEQIESALLVKAMSDSYDWAYVGMNFSSELIREMHELWLLSFYPSAGRYRTVDVSKGGVYFCPHLSIERELRRFDEEVLPELATIQGSILPSLELVSQTVALVHAEFILIHPFREGNGRLARWMADLIILLSGHPKPLYGLSTDQQRQEYFSALRRAFVGDSRLLSELFARWIGSSQEVSS